MTFTAVKCTTYHFHISFLETCKQFNVFPSGLRLEKKPFISFFSDELIASWEDTINSTQKQLLETLLVGIMEKLTDFEIHFWTELQETIKDVDKETLEEWLLKLCVHIDRLEKKVLKRKKKKIRKLLNDSFDQKEALTRMDEHKICFNFKSDLISFCETMFEDFENLFNLLSISGAPSFSKPSVQPTQEQDTFICENTLILNNSFENNFIENDLNNSINHSGSRLKGKFVSPNVFNLSKRQLSESSDRSLYSQKASSSFRHLIL